MGSGFYVKVGNLNKADIIAAVFELGQKESFRTISRNRNLYNYIGHGAKSGNLPTHDDQGVSLKDVVDVSHSRFI